MRIISGQFKGRRFNPPADKWPTRPTTDFAREGLFNILQNHLDFPEVKMLDLFGGTGAHSYEFLSRGCTDVTYVDNFPGCVNFVKQTADTLGVSAHLRIVRSDVFRFIDQCSEQFDYIFAGPPYPLPTLDTIPDEIFGHGLLRPGGWLVLEHNPHHDFEDHPRFWQLRTYGKTYFSFFLQPGNEEAEG